MLKFYHAPWSRSSGVLWLLEELGVPYETEIVDIRAEGGVPESYRAIQPNKKVPAIAHDGVVVTERAAITVYLADAFPEADLAPAIGDPRRGPYLTWNVYCDSVFDPALSAHVHGYQYKSNDFAFGLAEDMIANLERHLSKNDYAAGDRFTAADTQLASGIGYTMDIMKALPEKSQFRAYMNRIAARPAYKKAQGMDYQMAQQFPALLAQFAG